MFNKKIANRFMLGLMAGGVVFGAVAGSAAALGTDGGVIQAGVSGSLACDANGVYVSGWGLETDDNTVRSITLGDIDPACSGAKMFLKVNRSGALSSITLKPVGDVIDAVTEKFSFASPYVAPGDITGLEVFIQKNGTVPTP